MIMKKFFITLALILSILPVYAQNETKASHFAWGLDLGSSIDMTGSEMTNINFSGFAGYKNDYFRALGIGAEFDIMTSNSSRSIPVYAMMRTSFIPGHHLLFGDFRIGASFNTIYDFKTQTGLYASAGIGITLAKGKSFKSHLILGYKYIARSNITVEDKVEQFGDLHYAAVSLGISF